jgi:predicted dehydrogenase
MKSLQYGIYLLYIFFLSSEIQAQPIKLITLDPGHFHAALVQKSMYSDIDSTVHVYAKEGIDLQLHLDRINNYNSRQNSPTNWKEIVYTKDDFFQKMLEEKKGNLVVLAGNNQLKTDYIHELSKNGFHILSDKPMAIDTKGFEKLKSAFDEANKNDVLLYDIMTERYEITTQLQKALSMEPSVFGTLDKGSPDDPSVTKISVHHFYKYVSGNVLTRPSWYFDVHQQGSGIVDVTTHLVDLIQWACFPEQAIDYKKNVALLSAEEWNTSITPEEFKAVTKEKEIPSFLKKTIAADGNLQIKSNGAFTFSINGVHAKVAVTWNYKAPDGTGDTHYSLMRGTKSSLIIKQGKEENYKPTLYIELRKDDPAFAEKLQLAVNKINRQFPDITISKNDFGWQLVVPEKYNDGHEAHFAQVMAKYLSFLKEKNMPKWEVPNMLSKYFITTSAKELASKKKS